MTYHRKSQRQRAKASSLANSRLRDHIAQTDADCPDAIKFHSYPKPHGRMEAHRLYLYSSLPLQPREERDWRTKGGLRIVGGYESLSALAGMARMSLQELGREYGARTN